MGNLSSESELPVAMQATSCTSDAVLLAFEERETLSPRANTSTGTHTCEKSKQPETDIRGHEKVGAQHTGTHLYQPAEPGTCSWQLSLERTPRPSKLKHIASNRECL